MAPYDDPVVVINGVTFRDVTNKTVDGPVYTYEEAKALTEGTHIITYKTSNNTSKK